MSQQRQPLIVSARNASVKRKHQFFRGFLAFCSNPPALFSACCTRRPTTSTGLVHHRFPGSRRALILPTSSCRNNPYFGGLFSELGTTKRDRRRVALPCAYPRHRAARPRPRQQSSALKPPTHAGVPIHVQPLYYRSTTVQKKRPAIVRRPHGPCRNRTYNLAIKSRLLCQLS